MDFTTIMTEAGKGVLDILLMLIKTPAFIFCGLSCYGFGMLLKAIPKFPNDYIVLVTMLWATAFCTFGISPSVVPAWDIHPKLLLATVGICLAVIERWVHKVLLKGKLDDKFMRPDGQTMLMTREDLMKEMEEAKKKQEETKKD